MCAAAASPKTTGPAARIPGARRGVAMLLVLITLTVGTVLAAAALSSRDNSSAIGVNAGTVTAASWAAEAGANAAQSMLETSLAWRASGDGVILQDFPLSGARVNALVTDLNGNPPEIDDRELILYSTASIDQLDHTVERRISLALPGSLFQPIDPFLSEFALFAEDSIKIEQGARVRSFPHSPEADTQVPIKIGIGFASSGNLDISDNASMRGVELFADDDASSALLNAFDGVDPISGGSQLNLDIPAHPFMLPSGFGSLTDAGVGDLTIRAGSGSNDNWGAGGSQDTIFADPGDPALGAGLGGGFGFAAAHTASLTLGQGASSRFALLREYLEDLAAGRVGSGGFLEWLRERLGGGGGGGEEEDEEYATYTLPRSGTYGKIEIENAGVLIITSANGTRYQIDELIVDTDGVVQIVGEVELFIQNKLELTQGSTIELANSDSALRLYIGDDMFVSNSVIGLSRTIGRNIARTVDDVGAYVDPRRCRIMSLSRWSGGKNNPDLTIDDQSLVLGCLHSPDGLVEIKNHSAVIGQIVAGDIEIEDSCTFYYDPTLDSRAGYSSTSGPIYQNGSPLSSVVAGLNAVGDTQGAAAAAYEVIMAMRNQWSTSQRWEILDSTDSDANNPSTYDGYKIYDRAAVDGTWKDYDAQKLEMLNNDPVDPLKPNEDPLALEVKELLQMAGVSVAGSSAALKQEDLVLPTSGTSRTPSDRVRGRVNAASGNRAARTLERKRDQ